MSPEAMGLKIGYLLQAKVVGWQQEEMHKGDRVWFCSDPAYRSATTNDLVRP